MANKGYFVITDSSGYTEYLTGSELAHPDEILQSLFDAQLKTAEQQFRISGFRGDAIFMYLPETNCNWKPFEDYTLQQSAMQGVNARWRSYIVQDLARGKITAN